MFLGYHRKDLKKKKKTNPMFLVTVTMLLMPQVTLRMIMGCNKETLQGSLSTFQQLLTMAMDNCGLLAVQRWQ